MLNNSSSNIIIQLSSHKSSLLSISVKVCTYQSAFSQCWKRNVGLCSNFCQPSYSNFKQFVVLYKIWKGTQCESAPLQLFLLNEPLESLSFRTFFLSKTTVGLQTKVWGKKTGTLSLLPSSSNIHSRAKIDKKRS